MKISYISADQWKSIFKAMAYAFVSAFVTTLLIQPELSKAALYASAVAGVNAVFVTIKKLFTDPEA